MQQGYKKKSNSESSFVFVHQCLIKVVFYYLLLAVKMRFLVSLEIHKDCVHQLQSRRLSILVHPIDLERLKGFLVEKFYKKRVLT